MIISLEKRHQVDHPALLDQMFRARKRVFFDRLGWDVEVHGDLEKDSYDELDPVYLILTGIDQGQHHASLRLMPTTGPTLLHDVFRDTMPSAGDLSAPEIWECTRFCIDPGAEASKGVGWGVNASSLLLLAMCELGLKNGIEMIVANFDPVMKRIYKKAGLEVDILGVSRAHGRRPVACGTFEVSPRNLRKMRKLLGIDKSVFEQPIQKQRKAA